MDGLDRIKDSHMATHPLRAWRPSLSRWLSFDQGAFCLAIALASQWHGLLLVSLLATALGIAGLASGTMQVRATIVRRQRAAAEAEAMASTRSPLTP